MIRTIFRDKIDEAAGRIFSVVDEELTKEAKEGLEKVFTDALGLIAGNTLDGMRRDIISRSSPFAAFDMSLCTREQIRESSAVLKQELKDGKLAFSETLMRIADDRIRLLENALLTMFSDLKEHKEEICKTLFGDRQYTRFINITVGAGDYHNGGKSVTVFETDLGKMVYKPRSLTTDIRLGTFSKKYFPDCVYIPRCFTDGESFGVSEYVIKSVATTKKDAEAWYRHLGGLAVMLCLLGSTDMHHENITAVNGVPAIIDPETVMYPQVYEDITRGDTFRSFLRRSVYFSSLMPAKHDDTEYSILDDKNSEYSCVPVMEGKCADWNDYSGFFFDGFRKAYRNCIDRRREIKKDIPKLFSDIVLRVMLANTQYYGDLLVRTYKRRVLENEEGRKEVALRLEKVLATGRPESEHGIIQAETVAILRGDIPSFYTYGDSKDLYADGKIVYPGGVKKSGTQHCIEILAGMSEEELSFEEDIICRCFTIRPPKGNNRRKKPPYRKEKTLSCKLALKEAEELFISVYDARLTAPDGSLGWMALEGDGSVASPIDAGLGTGISGIGLFAAALHTVSTDPDLIEKTQYIVDGVRRSLESQLLHLKQKTNEELNTILASRLGEASGFGGILRAMVLMERYQGHDKYTTLIYDSLELLYKGVDFDRVDMTDRIGGIAGLIATLCEYPELSGNLLAQKLIASGAGRLMELKTFCADGHTLWETISKRHIIGGAGHGMMGIAHSLYAAGTLLGNDELLSAAKEALDFELEAYSDKLHTWPDRRNWPPETKMHGYCSGAPGIGILCKGMDIEGAEKIALLAADAADSLPLLFRDHLCCGNSAIVEYYLTTDRRDEAGKILAGMRERKMRAGSYRVFSRGYDDVPLPTLLYGYTGIGYEMLRYTNPGKIYPVL